MEQPHISPHVDIEAVPDELLGHLHEANARFHESRQHVEAEMDAAEYRHQERVGQAKEELRRAERDVEDVDHRIHDQLTPPSNA